MSSLDRIPADQRAVLQLVLAQGRTYDELAGLLGIDPGAVRARAHAALESLGGAGAPDASERAELSDYLLGQASGSGREAATRLLASSAPARAWARAVADELEPLGTGVLPEIPPAETDERAAPASPAPPAAGPARGPVPIARPAAGPGRPATGPGRPATGRSSRPLPSRTGGAILLAGVGIVVAVILLLTLGGGDGKKTSSASAPTTTSASAGTGTGQTSTTAVKPIAQIPLQSVDGGTARGLAQIVARGSQRLILVAAQKLSPGAYALWLSSSGGKSQFLGYVPQRVGTAGQFVTQGPVPSNAGSFQFLLVTRESVSTTSPKSPTKPGTAVLRGALKGV